MVRTMRPTTKTRKMAIAIAFGAMGIVQASMVTAQEAMETSGQVGQSPWGEDDELGRLNLMTPASQASILSRIGGGQIYDLGVEYYIGMPSWQAAGDPHYRMWMTHTPNGTIVDDPMGKGDAMNAHVSYTGTALSMYAHTGTHIDALNHFGLDGKIYNGFRPDEHLGDRGWNRTGAETLPPIVARGIMIDVAAFKGVDMLPTSYHITRADLAGALKAQGSEIQQGDVVLVRTGRMTIYDDAEAYMADSPGLGLDGARYLADAGAMIIGGDNLSLEAAPSKVEDNYLPIHTYLLAEKGIPIMELVDLEALSDAKLHEFAFIGASPKFRGSDAAIMRPIAIPLRPMQ